MLYFVFDSNLVRTNSQWVILFSSIPKIGHCSYIQSNDRSAIAFYVGRSIIKPTWVLQDDVYLAPNNGLNNE